MTTEREIPFGAWPRMRARIRPLRPEEAPASEAGLDLRMVEYFRRRGSFVAPDMIEDGRHYDPLRAPDLLANFLRVFGEGRPSSDEEIVDFYARHGYIGEIEFISRQYAPAWVGRLEATDQEKLLAHDALSWQEPVWWVQELARTLRLVYDIYLGLREDRLNFVRSVLGPVPEECVIVDIGVHAGKVTKEVAPESAEVPGILDVAAKEQIAPGLELEGRPHRSLTDDECLRWGRELLRRGLNMGELRTSVEWEDERAVLARRRPGEVEGVPGSPKAGVVRVRRVRSLLGALYMQLGELVARDGVLRQCMGCDRLFYQKHGNQSYCTPHCADAYRQRELYQERTQGGEQRARRSRRRSSR